MPQIRKKYRKVTRVMDIRKRAQIMKYKSYVPLCEKLKTNNSSLAKALSEEKQECQLLYSQKIALIAEVQDLVSACNKRDAVIMNISNNSKEMLKMLVSMTGYLTSTISMCQEYTSANTNTPYSSIGRRDSHRRVSTKSPTKGVVKPMVSGHTITKPTINLSRVNMQDINNASNLSVIPEVVTPPRTRETNSLRSPVSVAVRQRRCDTDRTCRLPERLTVVSSPRSSENERRLSKRSSRHSGRMSGKHSRSKSGRLSGGNSTRCSIGNFECIRSPTVKLNDVSKFLQNSQSINIRLLTETRKIETDEASVHAENSDDLNQDDAQDDSEISVTIPETPPSDTSVETNEKTVVNNVEILRESDDKNEQNSTTAQDSSSNYDDPLEGPSWLFNNFQTVPCNINIEKKTDDINVSIDNSMSRSLVVIETSDESDDEKPMEESQSLLSEQESKLTSFSESVEQENTENDSVSSQDVSNDTGCDIFVPSTPKDTNQKEHKTESEPAQNLANFVTLRRGCPVEEEEDEDDFTLMFVRNPRDMQFDINDLKFPEIEESTLKPIASVEPEPEVTTTLRKISQICQIPSITNKSIDESVFNYSTVNLPLLVNNEYDNKEKSDPTQRKKKAKTIPLRDSDDFIDAGTTIKKQTGQTNKKTKSAGQDPSAAKVVLQKLDKSDVKSRTPSPEELSNSSLSLNKTSLRGGDLSDSENSNASTDSMPAVPRSRRKRVTKNMQEPSLRKKLRRNS
ncbi:uncharacterized protein LOC143218291 isoform X2 [Lasioglossum baleicum]|uniref:uncharacterized protein LOC143218291 isoform X2 n=1 Tax=Lasioglossum baleicum TaxID=434251 RepID=UPI003FCD4C05